MGTRPGRTARAGYLLVVLSLLGAALGAVPRLAGGSGEPVVAETGQVFSCGDDGGGGEPSEPGELDLFLDAFLATMLGDGALFTFRGLAPPGVTLDLPDDGVIDGTDPATGGTLFTVPLGTTRIGQANGVQFLAAAGDEITFALAPRLDAGADGDDMGLERLFRQNFGLPEEPGGGIAVLGVDVDLTANPALTALPRGFRGHFEGVFPFTRPDGTEQIAGFRFELNTLAEGAAVPGESSLSFALKEPGDPAQTYYALGQTAEFAGFDGDANQPALGFGLDLALIDGVGPGATERDLVATDVGWSAAPRQAAFGFAQLCPARGHVGWNLDPTGLPAPEAAAVDVDFRLGDQVGQEIRVDDGAGGSTEERASELVLDGRIAGLPSLMDFVMLNDALSFTRSADVAPDVVVDRFHLAADDPEREDELALHARGQLTDMARHVLFVADLAEGTGAIERGELTSWTLDCPGEPEPPGGEAPEDVRRPDRTDTLPFFPEECARHALAPVPRAELVVQNWLPEDLDAQAATAGLRPPPAEAGQFGYIASRSPNTLSSDGLFAFGGRIDGLQRATIDLTRAANQANAARVYVERDPGDPDPDDSARFVVDVDALGLGQAGRGTRVTTAATIADLPDALRVDYASLSPSTSPLDITWRADAPIAISGGTFDVRFAAGAHFELHGAFEIGAAGADPLPPAGRIQVTRNNSADQRNRVLYSAPGEPGAGDGFPTPDVPAYDPDDRARLHVGAELSQDEDRLAGVAVRVHADLAVPQPVEVIWDTGTDGRVRTVLGGYECDPGNQSQVRCQAGNYDVAVVRGPRGPLTPAALLTRPALPTPTTPTSQAVPAFGEFRPGSGARAVILGANAWGAEVKINGLARFHYQRELPLVRVTLVDTAPQAFRLQLLDASNVVQRGGQSRPQVLFADAGVDRLPRTIVVRQRDATAAPDQPWLWVNTEGDGIRDINRVDWTPDPAGTRPRLTGVLRMGDARALRDELPFAARPTGARSAAGADLWADYDLDQELLALDAAVSLEVPRHVALWRPTLRRCGEEGTDNPPGCQRRRHYEVDEIDDVEVRYRTTSTELGDLNLLGDLHGNGYDWTARAHVDHVPGDFAANVTIAENRRLPWTAVDVAIDGNTPLGAVTAEVVDNARPVEYRVDADPADEPQCSEANDRCTAKFAVALRNVTDDLHVTGRIQGNAEERLTPAPDEPTDPDAPQEADVCPEGDDCSIGYVHAELDLRNTADRLFVEGREAADGQLVGSLRAYQTIDFGDRTELFRTPVSGTLNARVDHLVARLPRSSADDRSPFSEFFFDAGGVIGSLCIAATGADDGSARRDRCVVGGLLGRFVSATFVLLDLGIGVLAEILLDGPVTTDVDIDADLPLLVQFDRADTVRFGMNGTTLSIDERQPDGGLPATIAVSQRSMDHEDDLQVDGAWFHHRDIEISHDAVLESFSMTNDETDARGDVGLFRHVHCKDFSEDDPCYELPLNTVTRTQVAAAAPRDTGFASADIVVDFIFTPANRAEADDENAGFVEPGVLFYENLANGSLPVVSEAFTLPDLSTLPMATWAETFDNSSFCCADIQFTALRPSGIPPEVVVMDLGATCGLSDPAAVGTGPRAVGTDGTEYVVVVQPSNAVPTDSDYPFCEATRLVLEAHFPGPGTTLGPPRWSVVLPTPAGLDDDGACFDEDVRCRFATSVAPKADGSVEVRTTTTRIAGGVDGGSLDGQHPEPGPIGSSLPTREQARERFFRFCCQPPDIESGTSSTLGTVRAWVDASGHPGFDRPEAAAVASFAASDVTMNDGGGVLLDSCAVAQEFGCGFSQAGWTLQWVFGDGTVSFRSSTARRGDFHQYPRATDDYLGMLVLYDENDQIIQKAYFQVTN